MRRRPEEWPSPHWMPSHHDFQELPTDSVASAERWSGLGPGPASEGLPSQPRQRRGAGGAAAEGAGVALRGGHLSLAPPSVPAPPRPADPAKHTPASAIAHPVSTWTKPRPSPREHRVSTSVVSSMDGAMAPAPAGRRLRRLSRRATVHEAERDAAGRESGGWRGKGEAAALSSPVPGALLPAGSACRKHADWRPSPRFRGPAAGHGAPAGDARSRRRRASWHAAPAGRAQAGAVPWRPPRPPALQGASPKRAEAAAAGPTARRGSETHSPSCV